MCQDPAKALYSMTLKIYLEIDQDSSVEWPWIQVPSQAHENHNYLQNNCWWKRLEPTRKKSATKGINKEPQLDG